MLSGNRNFEGRVHAEVRMNYLASPPLVVAYAIAGTMDIDLYNEPVGQDSDGNDVFLKDIWPSQKEVSDAVSQNVSRDEFTGVYQDVFKGADRWVTSAIHRKASCSAGATTPPISRTRPTSKA